MVTSIHDSWVTEAFGIDPRAYAFAQPGADLPLDDDAAAGQPDGSGQQPSNGPDPSPSSPSGAASPGAPTADPSTTPDVDTGAGGAGFTKTPEAVEKEVTDKFGGDIPKDQLANSAAKVTNFQDDTTFKNELNTRHPDLKKLGIDPSSVMGESYQGKIYINKDKADIGTAYHEQLHHYSNQKFIDACGVIDGVKFNEGVTEYFTRQIYSGDRSGHYDSEYAVARVIAGKLGEDILKKAYFQGDDAAISKVKDALAKK